MVEQWNTVVEQCGTEWWNSGIVWWNSVKQQGGTVAMWKNLVQKCETVC